MARPWYSVVIPAYNEAGELPATLAALRAAMDGAPFEGECLVVDNASTDRTAGIARSRGADRVVAEPARQIARARNAGAREASPTSQCLVFLDADTRIAPELLRAALERVHSGEWVGGGALVDFEGAPPWAGRFGIGLWRRISRSANLAAGSFVFCRRDAFEAVGGFDERLFAGEEIRVSRELKRWGRERGRRFGVLETPSARTSGRKLEWYSGVRLVLWGLFFALVPVAVRSRRLCAFWYRRPG